MGEKKLSAAQPSRSELAVDRKTGPTAANLGAKASEKVLKRLCYGKLATNRRLTSERVVDTRSGPDMPANVDQIR